MNKSSQKISKKQLKLLKNATIQDTINRDRLREEINKIKQVEGIYKEDFNKAEEKLLNLFFGE